MWHFLIYSNKISGKNIQEYSITITTKVLGLHLHAKVLKILIIEYVDWYIVKDPILYRFSNIDMIKKVADSYKKV